MGRYQERLDWCFDFQVNLRCCQSNNSHHSYKILASHYDCHYRKSLANNYGLDGICLSSRKNETIWGYTLDSLSNGSYYLFSFRNRGWGKLKIFYTSMDLLYLPWNNPIPFSRWHYCYAQDEKVSPSSCVMVPKHNYADFITSRCFDCKTRLLGVFQLLLVIVATPLCYGLSWFSLKDNKIQSFVTTRGRKAWNFVTNINFAPVCLQPHYRNSFYIYTVYLDKLTFRNIFGTRLLGPR